MEKLGGSLYFHNETERILTLKSIIQKSRLTDAFERKIANVFDTFLSKEEPVIVAVSGGSDSTALLIASVRVRSPNTVIAANFNHQLRSRKETEADTEFISKLSNDLGCRFLSGISDNSDKTDELSARIARYQWLAKICREENIRICSVGHNEDDQAETILFRLARGTGLNGMSGMKEFSDWPLETNQATRPKIIRPLLNIARAEIDEYLTALKIIARFDVTNSLNQYARNRVRNRIFPELEQINSNVKKHFADFAKKAAVDEDALNEWATGIYLQLAIFEENEIIFPRKLLSSYPLAIWQRIFVQAADELDVVFTEVQLLKSIDALNRSGFQLILHNGRLVSNEYEVKLIKNNDKICNKNRDVVDC